MMGGWKTWAAAVGLALLGGVDLVNGDLEQALTKLSAAMGLVGLGHKIDKGNQTANG